jgi:hypothetical protein
MARHLRPEHWAVISDLGLWAEDMVRENVARAVGVDSLSVSRAEMVRKTNPEKCESIKRGEITVDYAYNAADVEEELTLP